MMQEISFIEGVIETDSGPISVQDLSSFLYHFRAVYVEARRFMLEHQIDGLPQDAEIAQMVEEVSQRLASKGRAGISRNALANLPVEADLSIADISRRNPLDLVFKGVLVALVIAVIISGGEVELGKDGVKFKLPPMGTGIVELKKAIYGNKQPNAQRRVRNVDSTSGD